MTFTKTQQVALLLGTLALSACGGGGAPATDRFTVSLESVEIVGQNNEPIAISIDGVSHSRELEAK